MSWEVATSIRAEATQRESMREATAQSASAERVAAQSARAQGASALNATARSASAQSSNFTELRCGTTELSANVCGKNAIEHNIITIFHPPTLPTLISTLPYTPAHDVEKADRQSGNTLIHGDGVEGIIMTRVVNGDALGKVAEFAQRNVAVNQCSSIIRDSSAKHN